MKNKTLIAALLWPIILLGLWMLKLDYDERTLTQKVTVRALGYDPRDLLAGHYLSLRPDWAQTDCGQFAQDICPKDDFEFSYRFYMPEKEAEEADKRIRRQNPQIEMIFLYQPGKKPRLKTLSVDGQPWQKWLELR